MNKLVVLAGMPGAGKSVLADALVERGYGFLRFGQITLDKVKELGLEPNEKNQSMVREGFRKEHGMGAYATLNLPKFEELLAKGNVVGDGMRSWAEYEILKEQFGDDLILVAVFAPRDVRYKRMSERKVSTKDDPEQRQHHFSYQEARERDLNELKVDIATPIAMADYTICNDGTLEEYQEEIKRFIEKLEAGEIQVAK